MKNGHCPMCNSEEVYANPSLKFRARGSIVDMTDDDGVDDLGAAFTPYICTNCGFTAMFVEDMEDIKDLPQTKGWKKVK